MIYVVQCLKYTYKTVEHLEYFLAIQISLRKVIVRINANQICLVVIIVQ